MNNQNPFKWRHFEANIILLCVRWYLRYSLSYRDLEEMMRERGLHVHYTTIYRWVQCYAPELEKRCKPHLKVTTDSWRWIMIAGAAPAVLALGIQLVVPESERWKEAVSQNVARPVREIFAAGLLPRTLLAIGFAGLAHTFARGLTSTRERTVVP